jgi:hypothetical protein
MKRKLRNNKKGMSIVISTVIIVAISITMAIAVAFWAMGIGNSFTKFEKLEFVSAYVADQPVQYPGLLTRAYATAYLSADGSGTVGSITMNSYGSGYITSYLNIITRITINNPIGFAGASATAHLVSYSGSGAGAVTVVLDSSGSGYTTPPTLVIDAPPYRPISCYAVYLQIKNTGSAAATINNIFLDGKPYYLNAYQSNIIDQVLSVGNRIGSSTGNLNSQPTLFLPVGGTWNRGDYVEVEIQTNAGRIYSTTVVLP